MAQTKSKILDEFDELPVPIDPATLGFINPRLVERAAGAYLQELRNRAGDMPSRPSGKPLEIPFSGRPSTMAAAILKAAMAVAGVAPRAENDPSPRHGDPSALAEASYRVLGETATAAIGHAAIVSCNLQPATLKELSKLRRPDGMADIRESDHPLLYGFAKYLLAEVRREEGQRRDKRARMAEAEARRATYEEAVRQKAYQLVQDTDILLADMAVLGRGFDAGAIRQRWVVPLKRWLGIPEREITGNR